MIKMLNEKVKKLDMWDMAFTKLAVMFFMMFLFSIWPSFRNFIQNTGSLVLFFAWIVFALRPLYRFFSKTSK